MLRLSRILSKFSELLFRTVSYHAKPLCHCCPVEMAEDWDRGLPFDIFAVIARGSNELKAMRAVSKTWQAGFDPTVSKISIHPEGPALPLGASLSMRFPGLTALHLGCAMSHPDLRGLWALPNLMSLSLGDREADDWDESYGTRRVQWVTDTSLWSLYGKHLKQLSLGYCCHLTQNGMRPLGGMPLTSLNLEGCGLGDSWLPLLEKLPLRSLNLRGNPGLTDAGLLSLCKFPLTSLNLGRCRLLTDGGLEVLRGLPLVRLGLQGCVELTDAAVQTMLHWTGLTDLDLRGCYRISQAGFESMTSLPITRLGLGGVSVSGGVLDQAMPITRDLGFLRGMRVTDLDLSGSFKLLDQDLAELKGVPLSSLNLSWCMSIGDVGLAFLKGSPITCLDLRECRKVTTSGLVGLIRELPLLVPLNLKGCSVGQAVLVGEMRQRLCSEDVFPEGLSARLGGIDFHLSP